MTILRYLSPVRDDTHLRAAMRTHKEAGLKKKMAEYQPMLDIGICKRTPI
jgi:hypothetical protein